jgi:tRNA (cytosine49-C5)-methyltransferase
MKRKIPEMKPEFKERMELLLGKDFEKYKKILKKEPPKSIRCNTLKIIPSDLKRRLETDGWKIKQPWPSNKEVMIVENKLEPGELGRSLEHQLGYYYVQELASMLPPIVLEPKPDEIILDMCASPGSKTTQIAAEMENSGTLIANEVSMGRMKILSSNLERCGTTNTLITKKDGIALAERIAKYLPHLKFDKILIDAPCSGEGTLRSSLKTYKMWNLNTVNSLSKLQKRMIKASWKILKVGGTLVYSTCTHSPEENEEVIDFFLNEFYGKVKTKKIELPIKFRPGIIHWKTKTYSKEVEKTCRVYPQDNNTEGFFIAKLEKIKE